MMALQGPPKAYLGLDIGTQNIKLVEIIDRGRRQELSTYAYASLSPEHELADVITRMMEKAQTSSDAVVMSLPNGAVFGARLALPDLPEDELKAAVAFQAREVVPVPLREVELKWQKQPGGVYLTAVSSTAAEGYRDLARRLNLKLAGLEAEIFSVIRAHDFTDQGSVLFCNIGGSETTLHLAQDGFPLRSRKIDAGARRLSEDYHRYFPSWWQEIQRFGRDNAGGTGISRMVLLGGGAGPARPREQLSEVLASPLSVINPWQSLSHRAGLENALAELGPMLAVAVGLAKRKLPAL